MVSIRPPTVAQGFAPFINAGTNASAARASRVARAIERKINTGMKSIAGAIRRQARKSIKSGGSKNRKHSRPGTAIISPKPSRIMYNTVYRDYNARKMRLRVGFSSRGFSSGMNGTSTVNGVSIPRLLEYGGSIYARKPTVTLASRTAPKWVTHYWKIKKAEVKAKRRRRGLTARQMPLPKKRDIKWVVIPPGNRRVEARPTMRLAFNKVATAGNLTKHWRNIGITDPTEIQKHIF